MNNNLFNKTFIHFLSFYFVLSERNNTVLKNLLIINIILLKLMSVTNNIKMKLIINMSNNQFDK